MKPEKPMDRQTYLEWSKSLPKEGCMLCDYPKWQIILKEWEHWVLVYSCAPYKKWNMMLIPKRHIEYMHEVNDLEWFTLKVCMRYCYNMFHTQISAESEYIWLWRTRDDLFDKEGTKKKGKRLAHLHLHFMPEASRWLDPSLDSDAANEQIFNKVVEAVKEYDRGRAETA